VGAEADATPIVVRQNFLENFPMSKFRKWRKAKVRFLFQFGRAPHYPFYVRYAPSWGFGIPWPSRWAEAKEVVYWGQSSVPRRLRAAKHHGVQIVEWRGARWVVTRQLLGKSRVTKEAIFLSNKE